MKCKFCGNERPLVNAHIIPEGFYRRIRDGQNPLELIPTANGKYIKKSPNGVYDSSIVCRKCEIIWQEWDTYAQQLLAAELLERKPVYRNGLEFGFELDKFDYPKLKLFFISLLWRASVSNHEYFAQISLGEFEGISKQYITSNDPDKSDDFSVSLSYFEHPLGKVIINPFSYNILGVNYVRFYLVGYIADIKVDHQPDWFLDVDINKNIPLLIRYQKFETSSEFDEMKKAVMKHRN
jgi:hypothetical protein